MNPDGTILMRGGARPIEQGAEVDPASAGVKLIGPPKWRDGSPVRLVWTALASVGSFKGHSAGPFEMTVETFDEVCRNFNARGLPLAFDYEHASEMDASSGSIPQKGAHACGWVHMLVNRGPDGLWGAVEWLDDARDAIKAGKYAFVSPAIRFDSKNRVTGKPQGAMLSSLALTNAPFLSNLPQLIAAKDGVSHRHFSDVELSAVASCKLCCDKLMKLMDDDGDETAMHVASAELLLRDSQQQVDAHGKTIALKDTEIATLKAEIEKRDHADRTARVELAFSTWRDQKRLNAADKEAMLFLCSNKPDVFERAFPRVEEEHRHLLRTVPPEARPRREGAMTFDEASEGARR